MADGEDSRYFIGVDIGGTFTDLVIARPDGDGFALVKTLTTPDNPVRGVMQAVGEALDLVGIGANRLQRVVHATTLPTNLVLERKGSRLGYVTTRGFGDIFRISKHKPMGPDRYNMAYRRPEPLVATDYVVEIDERMDHRGRVVTPLDKAQAEAAIRRLAALKPEAVAICFLHSYANQAHEQQVAAIVKGLMPEVYIAMSSDIWPEYQEYERASTAVLSAYVGPTLAAYTTELEDALYALGFAHPIQIMQSNGGVMTAQAAARKAAYAIESGPAAGMVAAAHLARTCGYDQLIAFDMGGTTAKAGVVQRGQPRITHDFRVGGHSNSGARDQGEPIRVPVIDLAEVGAGGGSIAWIDGGGFLQLGPQSAGADPGPACYGLGGTEATVTDANLLLGYLDPGYFLGGRMEIFPKNSAKVLGSLAVRLGLDVKQVAVGFRKLANVHMASAIRLVTLQRGIDPRDCAIAASGGAGPLHVADIADHFGIRKVVVPPSPGVRSALGLLVSDLAYDRVVMAQSEMASADCEGVERLFAQMEAETRAELARDGIASEDVTIERSAGLRFASQALELDVAVPAGAITPEVLAQIEAAFRQRYFEGSGLRPSEGCNLVKCKLRAVGRVPKPAMFEHATRDGDGSAALKGTRPAFFEEVGRFRETPVYDRARLVSGDRFTGPAIIEEPDSTTICPPGHAILVDKFLNLLIERLVPPARPPRS
jgi:N-methylhydantoinase A